MNKDKGQVIDRVQCPQCKDTGKDNLVVYDNDSAYCFACGYYENEADYEMEEKSNTPGLLAGEYQSIPNRCISEETCKRYNYMVGNYKGKKVHIAGYANKEGVLLAQKTRNANKDMSWVGNVKDTKLFGMHLYQPSPDKFITITEGEIDALSVSEACGSYYPVVSLKNGAAGAKKDISENLEYFERFKHVVLCFDMDDAGQKAVQECLPLFDPHKVRVARLPEKDANAMLVAGMGKEIKNCIWQAKESIPASVMTIQDVLDRGIEKPTAGVPWPWPELTEMTYGIRSKSIYTIGAGSGCGKTTFLGDVVLHLANECKEKVACMFLESSVEDIVLRLAGGVAGKRFHLPGDDWNLDVVKNSLSQIKDQIYLYDIAQEGSQGSTWETIKGKIRYFSKALGIKFIVLDHLTAMTCHMTDERKGIDKCMAELGALVHELDCTLFLVSHLAKPMGSDGPSYEEGRKVSAASFRGSQSIQYWSSFMIALERNKTCEDEEERNIVKLRVLKDRFTGESDGYVLRLKYNNATSKLEVYQEQPDFTISDNGIIVEEDREI